MTLMNEAASGDTGRGKQVEEWSKFYGQRKRALWGWGRGAGAVGVPGKERERQRCVRSLGHE